MSTSVKYFHSSMPGAPTLNGVAGSLIAVLDACLVDGFGLKSVDSLVVSGGIATLTIASGHSFEPDVVALVSGATPAGLNGEKRVLSTSTTTVTFDAAGITDQTASGAITVKLAPAGWEKPFSGTNLAVYRSLDPTGTRMFLRVDDTSAINARVVGYEAMTDANSGSKAFPSESMLPGGGWWPKADGSGTTPRAWTVVSDSRRFWVHLHTAQSGYGKAGAIWGFGDFNSYRSGDPYACGLMAADSSVNTIQSTETASLEYCGYQGAFGVYVPRSFTGLGGALNLAHVCEGYFTTTGPSGGSVNGATPSYPNGPNNGLILVRKALFESGVALRGTIPGVFVTPQVCRDAFSWRDKVDGQEQFSGRKLFAVKCGAPAGTSSQGVVFFDITGPWE